MNHWLVLQLDTDTGPMLRLDWYGSPKALGEALVNLNGRQTVMAHGQGKLPQKWQPLNDVWAADLASRVVV